MKGINGFYPLWIGIAVSIFGSELTEFAFGLWLLEKQMSVTAYTNMYLVLVLPAFLLMPLVGYVIDHYDKRKVLLLTEGIAGLALAIVLIFNHFGYLNNIVVYLYIALTSVLTALQIDCYSTLVFRLVPAASLNRANSLGSLSDSLPQMLAPIIGAFLFSHYGLGIVLTIDLLTFMISAFAAGLLFRVSAVQFLPHDDGTLSKLNWKAIFPDIGCARLVKASSKMTYMIAYTFFKAILVGGALITIVPYFTTYFSVADAGYMMSIGGVSMVIVSLISAWRPSILRRTPLLVLEFLFAAGFVVLTQIKNIYVAGACIAISFITMRISIIKMQTLWQTTVPKIYHGRVFALRNLVKTFSSFIIYLITGIVLDLLLAQEEGWAIWGQGNPMDLYFIGITLLILPPLLISTRRLLVAIGGE
ncbi:MFS transporter [Xenorhabdus bovienii]|uniref:Putative MFS-type transporter n=1 Tax=Xenorhabdus bovienii TaxID=40576 RepID=A0A0B6XFE7_XENBV|nr:MFS transporter [Xenorhabdus bovienii]MCG3471777.1 MFS transporter [Xenorhabdus bovienii]CDM92290.1 putative MFS-type transporter [Xenorhabdus bovienii]